MSIDDRDRLLDEPSSMRRTNRAAILGGVGVAALVLAVWTGYRVGVNRPTVHWRTGSANSMPTQISASADGWAYDIPLDVPWRDAAGGQHHGDRPECLPPGRTPITVRLAEVDVHIDGSSWRQVVFVDCTPVTGRA